MIPQADSEIAKEFLPTEIPSDELSVETKIENTKSKSSTKKSKKHRESVLTQEVESHLALEQTEVISKEVQTNKLSKSVLKKEKKRKENVCSVDDPVEIERENEMSMELNYDFVDGSQELRRSKRNSTKVVSYNETELASAVLDVQKDKLPIINSEIRSKENMQTVSESNNKCIELNQKVPVFNDTNETKLNTNRKLNSDELFDLLKATPNENNVLTKPTSTFFNNFDEISDDFNDDNFDMFENILDKSIEAVIEENLAEKSIPVLDVNLSIDPKQIENKIENKEIEEKIYEVEPSSEIVEKDVFIEPKIKKSRSSKHRKTQEKLLGKEIESKLESWEKAKLLDDQMAFQFSNTAEKSIPIAPENQSNIIAISNITMVDSITTLDSNTTIEYPNITSENKSATAIESESVVRDDSLLAIEDVVNPNPSPVNSEESSLKPPPKKNSHKSVKNSKKKKGSLEETHCDICNRTFRLDNLSKHNRTIMHISKLSEIEAKEAEMKAINLSADQDNLSPNDETIPEVVENTSESSKNDLNLFDNLLNSIEKSNDSISKEARTDSPASFTIDPPSLKLADIIDDVLNKPSLNSENDKHNNFSNIIMQTTDEVQHTEIRRYKSLGERKSFDADQPQIKDIPLKPVEYFDPHISKSAAGTILEKQLTLLQNMIENRSNLSYIDDISISSAHSNSENNSLEIEDAKHEDSEDGKPENLYSSRTEINLKTNAGEPFLKPNQYEEISEDSTNLRNYDDQKSRKVLNRDEELFLECCSLLKSSSEVSNYSKKSNRLSNKLPSSLELKSAEEPDWMENKSLSQKEDEFSRNVDDSSNGSRIPTPLGDSFADNESNSNTISSNWNMDKSIEIVECEKKQNSDESENQSFSFEEVLNDGNNDKEEESVLSKFSGVISKAIYSLKNRKGQKRNGIISDESSCSVDFDEKKKTEDLSDASTTDSKKMLTKGAMKVFEGLKVSIPTEELNMTKVLNCALPKKLDVKTITKSVKKSKIKPLFSTKLTSKNNSKKKLTSKKKTSSEINVGLSKVHDIYDFEETQDNSDMFTKPDFRSFRNKKSEEIKRTDTSDVEDCADSMSFEALSSSTSSDLSSKNPTKTQQNITKKKCMIMGRIFKNAVKSRTEEGVREDPASDVKTTEDFAQTYNKPVADDAPKKPKMTEEEMNLAFDKLVNGDKAAKKQQQQPRTEEKTLSPLPPPLSNEKSENSNRKKVKVKSKKRNRTHSDETDDEFSICNTTKKRAHRKKEENNSINLEQELRECIGVASRKSQRKCTSGKQNVLVEYWSSDESSFETLLESQILEPKPKTPKLPKASEPDKVFTDFAKPFDVDDATDVDKAIENEQIQIEEAPKTKTMEKSVAPQKKSKSRDDNVNVNSNTVQSSNRRKRAAANPLYHWSSSSEDESCDLILVKPIRDEAEDDDRPIQHGWIVGDSPKKLVTMLAQAKGKKICDVDNVKEQGKKRTNPYS